MNKPTLQLTHDGDMDAWFFHREERNDALWSCEPPKAIRSTVRARDGYLLGATFYTPAQGQRPVAWVLIASATGVKQSFYRAFARHLARNGLGVVTFDYRGIGRSRPKKLRGFEASMINWSEDLSDMIDAVHTHARGVPLLMVGHSVGGQLLGVASSAPKVDGALFVGAQLGDVRHWDMAGRARMEFFFRVLVPASTASLGYVPGSILGGEHLPAGVAREWGTWCLREGYIVGGDDGARRELYKQFHAPLRVYSFHDDDFAPRPAVDALVDLYARARVEHKHVEPASLNVRAIGHFGAFRKQPGERLWGEFTAWLLSQAHARANAPRS